jgi:peptidoglycan/xylan/chitin deacetylase (PgdA/CDA1 family)
MKTISIPLWPEGRQHAVTFSYDDGRTHDRRLVEILNRYGLKGTFNLNAGSIGNDNKVTGAEVGSLYAGHEVACHFLTHPYPTRIPAEQLIHEVAEDRKGLETLTGGVVDGMAYPFGDWNNDVIQGLRACGIRYARTTQATNTFAWKPSDWLAWHPTSHDRAVTPETLNRFFTTTPWDRNARLYYIWGHSYEFDREGGWESIEGICRDLRERGGDKLWAATNGMVRDYADAAGRLRFGAGGQTVFNPSATDVWIAVDGAAIRVPAGSQQAL